MIIITAAKNCSRYQLYCEDDQGREGWKLISKNFLSSTVLLSQAVREDLLFEIRDFTAHIASQELINVHLDHYQHRWRHRASH